MRARSKNPVMNWQRHLKAMERASLNRSHVRAHKVGETRGLGELKVTPTPPPLQLCTRFVFHGSPDSRNIVRQGRRTKAIEFLGSPYI